MVRHWLRAGASGWRLDVADELPDDFIAEIRTAMEETAPDSFLLGEVWEDATTKVAYSQRRRYLLGRELHGVMNSPLPHGAHRLPARRGCRRFPGNTGSPPGKLPPEAIPLPDELPWHPRYPRILTVLGADNVPDSKADRAAYRLSPPSARLAWSGCGWRH